jgi:hypothetical protein
MAKAARVGLAPVGPLVFLAGQPLLQPPEPLRLARCDEVPVAQPAIGRGHRDGHAPIDADRRLTIERCLRHAVLDAERDVPAPAVAAHRGVTDRPATGRVHRNRTQPTFGSRT